MSKFMICCVFFMSTQAIAGGHHSGSQNIMKQIIPVDFRHNKYQHHQSLVWKQVTMPFVVFSVPVFQQEEMEQVFTPEEEQEYLQFMNQCIQLTHNPNMCKLSWEEGK